MSFLNLIGKAWFEDPQPSDEWLDRFCGPGRWRRRSDCIEIADVWEADDAGEDEAPAAIFWGGAGPRPGREEDSDRDERQPPAQVGEEA